MGIRSNRRSLATTPVFAIAAMLFAPWAFAGNSGFADKPGGGYNDPQLKLACSIAPNVGASLTLTEDTANQLYQFNQGAGTFNLNTGAAGGFTPATIPAMPQCGCSTPTASTRPSAT